MKVAIITGGGGGIGSATASLLASRGCRVVVADLNEEAAAATARQIGEAAWSIKLDVTDEAECQEMAAKVTAKEGGIDILVNSHGFLGAQAAAWQQPEGNWERVLAVNLNGVYYVCRAVLPYMIGRGWGRIVNMASIAGKDGNPNTSAYAAAKAGVIGFTKAVAKEVAQKGVLINAVAPAAIDTQLTRNTPKDKVDYLISKIPMGRIGRPEEVAYLIGWLCSEECSFSTGAVYDISGGRATY